MKLVFSLMFLVLAPLTSMANSLETDLDFLSLTDKTAVYRDAYEYIPYETTCSRQVFDGMGRECTEGRTERRCRKVAGVGEECWDVTTGGSCRDVPTYRTEYYQCTQQRRVKTKEFDHYVVTEAKVKLPADRKEYDLKSCFVYVTSNDDESNLTAMCSKTLIRGVITSQKTIPGTHTRAVEAELKFEKLDAYQGLLTPLEITETDSDNGRITFKAANVFKAPNVELKLTAYKNRILLKDKVLKEAVLTEADLYILEEKGMQATYQIDVQKFVGGFDATKKHIFKIELKTKEAIKTDDILNFDLKNQYEQETTIRK